MKYAVNFSIDFGSPVGERAFWRVVEAESVEEAGLKAVEVHKAETINKVEPYAPVLPVTDIA